MLKEERMRRHRFPSVSSAALFYYMAKLANRDAVAPHLNECSYYGAHHVSEETVGADAEVPSVFTLIKMCFVHLAQCGFYIGMTFAESGKVFIMYEFECCLIHKVKVQIVVALPGIMSVEGVLARTYIVMIRTSCGRESCMHVIVNELHIVDSDIGW